MKIVTVTQRPDDLVERLLSLWEASVRATHFFLTRQDILSIKPLVAEGLREIPFLISIGDDQGIPLGFMGIAGSKIEMLFISPEARGRGLGRRMVDHAVHSFGIDSVDVNEQNIPGVGFYIHLGFEVITRSPVDDQGKPFPLLKMKLRGKDFSDAPEGYTIRHAEPCHLPFLNDIELAAATIFPFGSIPEHVLSERTPAAVLAHAMEKARLWVALQQKQTMPVGYALLEICDGSALLAQIDMRPEHGRKGVGTALVHRVIRAVQGMGIQNLYLTTFSHVPWNEPFYKRLGFTTLDHNEQPSFLQEILDAENNRGLDNRVGMKLDCSILE